jgi:two-component system OmpR family response regulator
MSKRGWEGTVKALIIEGEPVIALSLADDLAAVGWSSLHVPDSAQAFLALSAERFDLAIIDLGLRDESGADLVRHIQTMAPTMRLVIYTGCVANDSRMQGLPSGIPVVEKPCSSAQFMQAIQTAAAYAHPQ